MDVKQFLPVQLLQDEYANFSAAKGEEELAVFRKNLRERFLALTNEERGVCVNAMEQGLLALKEALNDVDWQLKSNEIGDVVSMKYIAETYFKKSGSWLYHRLNGNVVNGKIVRFTDEERRQFANALRDISKRIEITATALA
jgi:hypothetical protein